MTNAAPPAPTPDAATTEGLAAQLQSFFTGLFSLDPTQAAIRGGLSILVLIGAALLLWGLRLLLKTLIDRVAPQPEDAPPRKRLAIGRWALRIARIAILITAVIIILRVWGFDYSKLNEGPVGMVLGIAGRIALIIVLALGAIEVSQLAISQVFTRIALRAKNIRRASQLRTLAPVLIAVSTTTIIIVGAMMALSEVGVEIGPLIAGAGIVGLAIGFGAQTLVKDFLTGIFLILEDIVSVGDVVRIGDFGGTVEEMSLRTIKLRDFDGTLHVFPYSEAQVIHNRTKSFSFAVFDLNVAHSANIARALDVMRATGDEVRADPSFAPFILSPIEVVGIDKLTDAGVLLKARIKTAPGKQWMVGRDYLRRIKDAFENANIELSAPSMKLVAADQPLAANPAQPGGAS